jgi:hypothetical protein
VHAPSPLAELAVEDGGQHRMGEADHSVPDLDDVLRNSMLNRVRGNHGPFEDLEGGRSEQGGELERLPGSGGEVGESRVQELLEGLREPQGSSGSRSPFRTRASSRAKNGFPPERS